MVQQEDEAMKSRHKGLWLVSCSTEEMVFRKPLLLRVVFGVCIPVWANWFYHLIIIANHNLTAIIPFTFFGGILILMLSWGAGLEETRFDLLHRAYHYRWGLLWMTTYLRTGSFDDLAGFRVPRKNQRGVSSLYIILGRPDQKHLSWNFFNNYPRLGEVSGRQSAEAQVNYLAETLGIPSEIIWY